MRYPHPLSLTAGAAGHGRPMSLLSLKFSQALAHGRRSAPLPDTRERLLVSLLKKRATAQSIGAEDLEAILRDQIKWAMPTMDAEGGREVVG